MPIRRRRHSAMPSTRRRSIPRRILKLAATALSTGSPANRWENEPGRRFGRRRGRQLGRQPRPSLAASLPAPCPSRPADRLLAVALAMLVVERAGRGGGACQRAEPLADRAVL